MRNFLEISCTLLPTELLLRVPRKVSTCALASMLETSSMRDSSVGSSSPVVDFFLRGRYLFFLADSESCDSLLLLTLLGVFGTLGGRRGGVEM
jgi:hypothetical protein